MEMVAVLPCLGVKRRILGADITAEYRVKWERVQHFTFYPHYYWSLGVHMSKRTNRLFWDPFDHHGNST